MTDDTRRAQIAQIRLMRELQRKSGRKAQTITGTQADCLLAELARADAEVGRLTRAQEALQQWQPIETAPKDGKWVVLGWFRPHRPIHINGAYWDAVEWRGGGCTYQSLDPEWCPTHWMPLPDPPKALTAPSEAGDI